MNYLSGVAFDLAMARRCTSLTTLTGFGGQSLGSFRRVGRSAGSGLGLLAANSHVLNVRRQHEIARRLYPVEKSWLNDLQVRRTLLEYQMADQIFVASDYSYSTFVDHGIPEHKLAKVHFSAHPRFHHRDIPPHRSIFSIVYVGSLTIFKGVLVLLDAFQKVATSDWRLTLVGGWATRGMRRYLSVYLTRDRRVRLAPGDPLPHLQEAHVAVHPSFEDGFAYAPMEALAVGVPVVATDHTGMKEYIDHGKNGYIVRVGDVDDLANTLVEIYRRSS